MFEKLNKPIVLKDDEELSNIQLRTALRSHGPEERTLPDKQLILLGQLLINFQSLEATVKQWRSVLSNNLSIEGYTKTMASKDSFRNHTDALIMLVREKHPREIDLMYVVKRICETNTIRNNIIHSSWGISGMRFRGNGKIVSYSLFDDDNLEEYIAKLAMLTSLLDTLAYNAIEQDITIDTTHYIFSKEEE